MRRILKGFFSFIMGMIFYPFIGVYVTLNSVGFFDKIKQLNWVLVITYVALGFLSFIWVKYVIVPLIFLISGGVID
jgi:hypothetical protein